MLRRLLRPGPPLRRLATPVAALGRCFLLVFQRIRIEHERDHQYAKEYRHINSRRRLDVIGNIAHLRYGKHNFADDIAGADQRCIRLVVGVALGAVAHDGRIAVIRNNFHNAVRGDHIGGHAERNYIVHAQVLCIHAPYIDQRTGGIGRFHGSTQHAVYLHAEYADAHDEKGENHRQNHQTGGQVFQKPNFLFIHEGLLLTFLFFPNTTSPVPLKTSIAVHSASGV